MATTAGPTCSRAGCTPPTARASVVNAGIGGNRSPGRRRTTRQRPSRADLPASSGSTATCSGLSGLTTVVWLEGINDLSSGTSAEAVIAGLKEGIRRLHAHGGVRVIGATITSSLGATTASGTPDVDARRKTINAFIRTSGIFDGIVDFDGATRDATTGGLRAEFQPNSSIGGAGDRCTRTAPAIWRWATPSI